MKLMPHRFNGIDGVESMEGVCIVCGCSFTPVTTIVDRQKMNFLLHEHSTFQLNS